MGCAYVQREKKEEEEKKVILSSDNLFFLSFVQLFLCKIAERNTLPISTMRTMEKGIFEKFLLWSLKNLRPFFIRKKLTFLSVFGDDLKMHILKFHFHAFREIDFKIDYRRYICPINFPMASGVVWFN